MEINKEIKEYLEKNKGKMILVFGNCDDIYDKYLAEEMLIKGLRLHLYMHSGGIVEQHSEREYYKTFVDFDDFMSNKESFVQKMLCKSSWSIFKFDNAYPSNKKLIKRKLKQYRELQSYTDCASVFVVPHKDHIGKCIYRFKGEKYDDYIKRVVDLTKDYFDEFVFLEHKRHRYKKHKFKLLKISIYKKNYHRKLKEYVVFDNDAYIDNVEEAKEKVIIGEALGLNKTDIIDYANSESELQYAK